MAEACSVWALTPTHLQRVALSAGAAGGTTAKWASVEAVRWAL